jgi:hypothetical protein
MRDARRFMTEHCRDERPFLEAPSFLDYLPLEPPKDETTENAEDDADLRVIIIEI